MPRRTTKKSRYVKAKKTKRQAKKPKKYKQKVTIGTSGINYEHTVEGDIL